MWEFFLTPTSIPLLAKFLLSIIITSYIIFFIPKSKTVFWFLSHLVGYTCLDFFAFIGQTVNSDIGTLNLPLQYLSSIVMAFSFLQFAYSFKKSYFPKEQLWVKYISGSIGLVCFVSIILIMASVGYGDYSFITPFASYSLLCILWSVVVFFRKYRKALHHHHDFKNGYLSFFVLSTLGISVSFSVVFEALDIITATQNMIIFFVLNLIIISLLTINFINYLSEKTTVLVKLVGLSLVLFITVIGLQGLLVIPNFEETKSSQILEQSQISLEQVHAQTEPYAWFLIGSIFIIIVIFPFFYNKSVLKPLKTLLKGVDQLNQGNLDVNIPIINQDEIGVVTNHFNKMATNLKKANFELKEYAEGLEERVRKRTEELNSKTKLLEVQTQELERMDNFRSKLFMDISHELRTPITLVSGPIKTLLDNQNLDKETERQLVLSLRNSERLKKLVEQIIDLNRLESDQVSLHLNQVDLSRKLEFFASSFEGLMKHHKIQFTYSIPEEPIQIYLDVDKFEKIINNIISNATKFTPKNGSVSLALIELDNEVEITISDTGKGIEESKLPTIFDRYQTSAHENTEYKEGLGVGLAITKEYVTLHGGNISVESKLGVGTTFTLSFKKGKDHLDNENIYLEETPNVTSESRYEIKESERDIASRKKPSAVSKKAHVLLVEDNPDMALYVKDVLEADGFTTTLAENGELALEQLKSTKPDLIVSDIMMPVMDGMEFLKNLRESDTYKNTPTIFLSARSDLEGRIESFRLGVNDYLIKPFDKDELICRIENLLQLSISRKEISIELSEDDAPSVDQEFINTLTKLVEERMANTDFNVEELAAEVAMSRSTLYREIKKATGFSAAAFVKEIRLQKARQKLENKQIKSVSELSYEIGFSTPSYFSKMYLKRFGKKPTEYLT